MYKSILAATDGSDVAANAVRHASTLATAFDAKLYLVTVTQQTPSFDTSEVGWSVPPSVFDDIRKANVERSRAILDEACRTAGLPAHPIHVENTAPYAGILDAAVRCGADLIVLGSHGHRGLQRLLLGSDASKVLSLSPLPVLIVKHKFPYEWIPGSEEAEGYLASRPTV